MPLNALLETMAKKKASDLFISVGSPIQLKINGQMHAVNQTRLNPTQVEGLLRKVISEREWERFVEENELNIGYGLTGVGSFRLSLFRQRNTTAAVIRYIPGDVPAFDSLGLPSVLKELIMQPRGLLLMVGATGAGKTTTLASMIDYRNANRTGHILTLEDPIEFVFRNQQSIVNQRQIGTDAKDLNTALKSALRQAPDCILIGEIRDLDAMNAAITYAQSGHLVLATLHANNAAHALNRIVGFYQPENRDALLSDLSTTLRAIVSQRLLRSKSGSRVPAVEVMLNTNHVSELISTGRVSEIPDAINNSLAAGAQSFDYSLISLLRAGKISREDALQYSDSPTNLLWLLENGDEAPASTEVPESVGELSLPSLLQEEADGFSARRPQRSPIIVSRQTLADLAADPSLQAAPLPVPATAETPAAPVRPNPIGPDDATMNALLRTAPGLELAPDTAKHGTLHTGTTSPAAAAPVSATTPSTAKEDGQNAQGASFAEFLIKL
ncbi:MAG: PilT/PilU family type 4a pilus ATPase [Lautropia sp.]|nr:PilT/PilU family type 4a pilus ATPase [Lautropia sp.]